LKVYPFSFGEFVDFKGFKYYEFDISNIDLFVDELLIYFEEYVRF